MSLLGLTHLIRYKNMFNNFIKQWLQLFKKQEESQKSAVENIVAITLYTNKEITPFIDILLENYNEETLLALCKLLDVINNEQFYIQVIDIIKNAMLKDNEEEKLLRILSHISQQKQPKLERYAKEKLKDEPCIKPSDMIK